MMNTENHKITFKEIKEEVISFAKSAVDCFIDLLIFLWSFISYVVLEIFNFFQEMYAFIGLKSLFFIILPFTIIILLKKNFRDLFKNILKRKLVSFEENPPSENFLKKDNILINNRMNFSMYLIQNPLSLILCSSIILLIIEITDITFSHFFSGSNSDYNGYLVIITCAVSVLFPTILMSILNYERGNKVISISQPIMKHSLAPFAGVILFSIIGRFAFDLNPYSKIFLSALSAMIAFFVLYRLMQASVSPKIRKELEKEIIKHQVYHSLKISTEERIGYIKIEKFFKSNNKNILFSIHPLSLDQNQKIIEVLSSKEGIVDKINIKALSRIYNNLNPSPIKYVKKSSIRDEWKSNKQSNLEFYLSTYVGQNIKRNQLIAKIYFKSNDGTGEEFYKKKILKCFLIKTPNEQSEIKEQFNELQENLKKFSTSAIRNDDLEQFKKIEQYLLCILDAQADMLQVFDIKYNAISSSNELGNRIFKSNTEWKPLSRVLDTIAEMSRIALEKDRSKKPEIIGRIRDLIHHLFEAMSERKDILSCFELLQLNFDLWRQCTQNNKEAGAFISKSTLENLRIFFRKIKYSFLQDSDGRLRKKEEQEYVIEFVKLVYFNIQDYLFTSICDSDLIQYQSFLDFTKQFPNFFKHERDDIELKLESFARTKKHHGLNKSSEQELEKLQAKKKIIDKIDNLKDKMYYGQGVLALMIKNGITVKKQEINIPTQLMKQALTRIPKKPIEAFKFLHQIEKEDYGDFKNKWNKWEHFSLDGEAKICKFYGALNDYQRLILIQRISQSNIDNIVFDEDLLDQNWGNNFMMWKVQKEVDSTITYPDIDKSIQLALDLELIQENNIEEIKINLMKFLDTYLKDNHKYLQRKIVEQPIYQDRIEKIKKDFDDSFVKHAQLRLISKKTEGIDDGTQKPLGILEIFKRDYFIEKPFTTYVDMDSFGTDYGRNTAQFEDNEIFKEIINQCKPTEKLTIEEAVQNCKNKIDLRTACILLPSSLEANDSLFSTPYYIPNCQFDEHVIKGKIVDADEFLEIDNIKIPILTFFKKQNNTNHVVILEKESITIEQIAIHELNSTLLKKSGFTFKLEDPKEDAKFRKELLSHSGNQKWLSQFKSQEEKEKKIALFVRMSITEKIRIKINNPEKVFVAILKLQKPKRVE